MLERVRQLLRDLAPDIEESLLPPASEEQLQSLQSQYGRELPRGLTDLYRESAGLDPDAIANFAFSLTFIDIDLVARLVRKANSDFDDLPLRFADPGIRKDFTHGKSRIEIGNDSSRCRVCVDLAPDAGGNYGQVVFVDEEYQVALLLARSVREFIGKFADDLASGKYSLNEESLELTRSLGRFSTLELPH